jgi:hypothetical protein
VETGVTRRASTSTGACSCLARAASRRCALEGAARRGGGLGTGAGIAPSCRAPGGPRLDQSAPAPPARPPPPPPQVRFARSHQYVQAGEGPDDNRQLFFSHAPPAAGEAELRAVFEP